MPSNRTKNPAHVKERVGKLKDRVVEAICLNYNLSNHSNLSVTSIKICIYMCLIESTNNWNNIYIYMVLHVLHGRG